MRSAVTGAGPRLASKLKEAIEAAEGAGGRGGGLSGVAPAARGIPLRVVVDVAPAWAAEGVLFVGVPVRLFSPFFLV